MQGRRARHGGGERGPAVGAGRGDDAGREGRGVEPVLGRADPVRADVTWRGSARRASAQEEAPFCGLRRGRRRRPAPARARRPRRPSGPRSPHLRREPPEILRACSSEISFSLPSFQNPARAARSRPVGRPTAHCRSARRAVRLGVRHLRVDVVVDAAAPRPRRERGRQAPRCRFRGSESGLRGPLGDLGLTATTPSRPWLEVISSAGNLIDQLESRAWLAR